MINVRRIYWALIKYELNRSSSLYQYFNYLSGKTLFTLGMSEPLEQLVMSQDWYFWIISYWESNDGSIVRWRGSDLLARLYGHLDVDHWGAAKTVFEGSISTLSSYWRQETSISSDILLYSWNIWTKNIRGYSRMPRILQYLEGYWG